MYAGLVSRLRMKCDGTPAETRFRLSAKRTSPFKSVGASVQSTTGSRGVRISCSNAGYTMSKVVWRVLVTHSIRQFPLHFPSRASPCAITFQLDSTVRDQLLWYNPTLQHLSKPFTLMLSLLTISYFPLCRLSTYSTHFLSELSSEHC